MRTLILFLASVPLWATVSQVGVPQCTPRQCLITFTVSHGAGNATVSAVDANGNALPDTNTSLFPASSAANRCTSVVNGISCGAGTTGKDHVQFVLGSVPSAATNATDVNGLTQSRVLLQCAQGVATITDTSDSTTATVNFQTKCTGLGNNFYETMPFNSSNFGNWEWPTLEQANNANAQNLYPDPLTGFGLRKITQPGWYGWEARSNTATNQITFTNVFGGNGWTNAANVLNGASGSGATTGNTNTAFLPVGNMDFESFTPASYANSGWVGPTTYDDVNIILTGSGNTAGHSQVDVCLSLFDSGATCQTGTLTVNLSTSGSTTVGVPDKTWDCAAGSCTQHWSPEFGYADWSPASPIQRSDFAQAAGNGSQGGVTVSGTTVTLTNIAYASNYFNVKWKAGALFYIAASGCSSGGTNICTIASVTDPLHLVITDTISAISTPAAYTSFASGYVVKKHDTTGTVTFGASYGYAFSTTFTTPKEGTIQPLNANAASVCYEADGATSMPCVNGYLGLATWYANGDISLVGGSLYLFIPSRSPSMSFNGTSEVRQLSPMFVPGGVGGATTADQTCQNAGMYVVGTNGPYQPFSATDPLTIYGAAAVGTGSQNPVFFPACTRHRRRGATSRPTPIRPTRHTTRTVPPSTPART